MSDPKLLEDTLSPNSEQPETKEHCENGISDVDKTLNTSLPKTNKCQISDQKPIKVFASPFLENNIISHELHETDICDNSSNEPITCDNKNINNNCIIKLNSPSYETNKEGLCYLNSNKHLLGDIKNSLNNHAEINKNNSLSILACSSNSGIKLKKDNVISKIDICKLKDDSEMGDKRVPSKKCEYSDSEEESSVEEDCGNEEFDNSAYNTEIQDVLLQVPKNPVTNFDNSRRSSLKRKIDDDYGKSNKRRKNIQFDGVTVFYFPRSQGFNCVPSQGGSTLGMSRKHFCIKRFSLTEHAAEQKRAHKEQILQSKIQKITSNKKGNCSSSEESEDTSDISDSEMEAESFMFLQPLPIRQRRSLLRQAGIRQIEVLEKENCKDIRVSREMCGCQCKLVCYPETCQCAAAGIKCQVDRHNFPCGCTRDGCGNTSGRIEFNPIRVRTHFLQTLMRMEIEKRHSQWENADRKKSTPSWFMNGPANSYIQSLSNSNQALSNEASNSHIPDSSNLCVSFDLTQHESKNSMEHYQGNGADYTSNGCYMFCGNVSPFDSVSSFSPSYCSTLSNFPTQNSFCHSCNSYSLSKLSCNSPFLSSDFYSNAAALSVVSPIGKNHYSYQNNLSFPSPCTSVPFNKINPSSNVNDVSNNSCAHNMQTVNGGPSNSDKTNNFLMSEIGGNKNEMGTSQYSKLCSLTPIVPQDACSSSNSCQIPETPSAISHCQFPQHKTKLNCFEEPDRLNSPLSSCASANPHHQTYTNVTNPCLDSSMSKVDSRQIPVYNSCQMLQLKQPFISEKKEISGEFSRIRFTPCMDESSADTPSSTSIADNENSAEIMTKVEALVIPELSCSNKGPEKNSSICDVSSLHQSSILDSELSQGGEIEKKEDKTVQTKTTD